MMFTTLGSPNAIAFCPEDTYEESLPRDGGAILFVHVWSWLSSEVTSVVLEAPAGKGDEYDGKCIQRNPHANGKT